MCEVWRAEDRYRGGDAAAGVDSRHAFSFSGFYDPDNVRFGCLVACNEERLAAGSGFPEHLHRDVEIVTWVLEGELEHRDSDGNSSLVVPGDVQRLSAGSGVWHTERNAGSGPLRFVQMWLVPGARGGGRSGSGADFGGEPEYEVVHGISDGTPFALARTDAVLHVRRLGDLERTAVPAAPWVYVQVARGTVVLGGHTLREGDAARISDTEPDPAVQPDATAQLDATAHGAAELLMWEMHAEPSYG